MKQVDKISDGFDRVSKISGRPDLNTLARARVVTGSRADRECLLSGINFLIASRVFPKNRLLEGKKVRGVLEGK